MMMMDNSDDDHDSDGDEDNNGDEKNINVYDDNDEYKYEV